MRNQNLATCKASTSYNSLVALLIQEGLKLESKPKSLLSAFGFRNSASRWLSGRWKTMNEIREFIRVFYSTKWTADQSSDLLGKFDSIGNLKGKKL